MPIHVKSLLLSPLADLLSKKGMRKKKRIAQEMRQTAIVSPFRPGSARGNNFRV